MVVDISMVGVFVVALLLSLWYLSRRRNLPPGPWGAHFLFGHALEAQRSTDFYLTFMEYRRRYGDIFRLRFGARHVIVLNGPAMIREALVEKSGNLSDRPDWLTVINKAIDGKGIIFNIHNWPFTRRFAMASMRDFGVGKSPIEEKCQEEIEVLMSEFAKHEGKPFNCQILMANAVSNIICGVVLGKRFDYDDVDFQFLMQMINTNFKNNPMYAMANFVPFLMPIALFFGMGKMSALGKNVGRLRNFIQGHVDQHRETFDPDNIRDFTDLFLQSEKEASGGQPKVSEGDAFRIIMDMFVAGTETTSTTLQWLLIYMMYNQDVQDKCRHEIHQVIGSERCPSMSDRGSMVYTEATLLEVQRIATIAPLALPHTAIRDVVVGGYTIPKGSFVVPNLYSCHRDYASWGDPDNFRPDRWIDEDGKLQKHAAFMPFSLGKRACAGESLAKMEIFLFGVAFLQRFKFTMSKKMPSLLGHQGTTNIPKPFELIANPCT